MAGRPDHRRACLRVDHQPRSSRLWLHGQRAGDLHVPRRRLAWAGQHRRDARLSGGRGTARVRLRGRRDAPADLLRGQQSAADDRGRDRGGFAALGRSARSGAICSGSARAFARSISPMSSRGCGPTPNRSAISTCSARRRRARAFRRRCSSTISPPSSRFPCARAPRRPGTRNSGPWRPRSMRARMSASGPTIATSSAAS